MFYAHLPKSRAAICPPQKRKLPLWRNDSRRRKCCAEFSDWKSCETILGAIFRKRLRLRSHSSKSSVPPIKMRSSREVSIRAGQVEFVKVGTDAWRWRDIYRWLLGLSWSRFAGFVALVYIGLNLLFAVLYSLQQSSIAGRTSTNWFLDCFFFSVQTLATVGYGHMYPQTLYGHVVSTIEIMTGIFPIARVVFSRSIVIAPLNGKPTLMVRIGNENHHSMVEAEFRIMFSRDQQLLEGGDFRHFYVLKLHFDHLTVFPAALTLRHVIDEKSPLHGATAESLEAARAL